MVQFPREIFVIRLYLINYVHVVDLSPTPWEQRAGLVPGMGVAEREIKFNRRNWTIDNCKGSAGRISATGLEMRPSVYSEVYTGITYKGLVFFQYGSAQGV